MTEAETFKKDQVKQFINQKYNELLIYLDDEEDDKRRAEKIAENYPTILEAEIRKYYDVHGNRTNFEPELKERYYVLMKCETNAFDKAQEMAMKKGGRASRRYKQRRRSSKRRSGSTRRRKSLRRRR